ncbi:MAG: endonuclease/exonuclease/phosphatase family protein, partial [Arcobacteraceae bacterium]
MKYFLFIFIATFNLFALDFKVASYNVENFFDLQYDKTEYKEFIPNTKSWNTKSYTTKLTNVSKVIKNLDADILALQEIESRQVLDALTKKNPDSKYSIFTKNKNTAIGLGLMSKFPIVSSKNIIVDKYDKYSRDIL